MLPSLCAIGPPNNRAGKSTAGALAPSARRAVVPPATRALGQVRGLRFDFGVVLSFRPSVFGSSSTLSMDHWHRTRQSGAQFNLTFAILEYLAQTFVTLYVNATTHVHVSLTDFVVKGTNSRAAYEDAVRRAPPAVLPFIDDGADGCDDRGAGLVVSGANVTLKLTGGEIVDNCGGGLLTKDFVGNRELLGLGARPRRSLQFIFLARHSTILH
eukprot:1195525-Prorocentrum_minimum.AAC.4